MPASALAIGHIVSNGGQLVFSGANGAPGGLYYVLVLTNLTLPLTNWTVMGTNAFDPGGHFIFTNPVDPAVPLLFYLLRL